MASLENGSIQNKNELNGLLQLCPGDCYRGVGKEDVDVFLFIYDAAGFVVPQHHVILLLVTTFAESIPGSP